MVLKKLEALGAIFVFLAETIGLLKKRPFRWPETIRHIEFIGNRSIGIIALTGLFTGLVFSFQAYLGFSLVNATNLVGATSALGIARELGPVLSGLILAARAGGAMAAQLGTMRVTEQIDALEVMGVNSKQYLVLPRIIAATIATPLVTGFFIFVAMIGTYIFCIWITGLDPGIFWDKIGAWLQVKDLFEGLLKGLIFGLLFSVICCYWGYYTDGGAKGVGESTNMGVVTSMVSIIVADYFVTKIYRMFVSGFL